MNAIVYVYLYMHVCVSPQQQGPVRRRRLCARELIVARAESRVGRMNEIKEKKRKKEKTVSILDIFHIRTHACAKLCVCAYAARWI